jgi:TP53 regulating kinase-like protein
LQRVYKLPSFIPPPTVKWPSKLKKQLSDTPPAPQSSQPLLLKHRFRKQYRHPVLDANLTKSRLQAEARALARCAKAGIAVPGVRVIDLEAGILGMEWVDGWSVREMLGGGAEDEEEEEEDIEELDMESMTLEERDLVSTKKERIQAQEKRLQESEGALEHLGISPGEPNVSDACSAPKPMNTDLLQYALSAELMRAIGTSLAKMHANLIVHGDLTTSNMMLRPLPGHTPNFEVVSLY